ncbi:hypothetical protein ACCD02_32045 [Pseudomonas sp. Pseusp88]|uniref:hypothetical protein n=1 Tax=Pseudomonas sp. Pseusp88 TaxID=3243061 RepID=UPI0039A65BB8
MNKQKAGQWVRFFDLNASQMTSSSGTGFSREYLFPAKAGPTDFTTSGRHQIRAKTQAKDSRWIIDLYKKYTAADKRHTSSPSATLAPVIHRLLHSNCVQGKKPDISRRALVSRGDKDG